MIGHWVIGMIAEGSDDLRIELCPCNENCPEGGRSAEDLIPLIKRHVALKSIIYTDSWRAYRSLNGYTHKIVNHFDPENHFRAPDGTQTQRIKSNWRPLKDYFRGRRVPRDKFADALIEFGWRRSCKKSKNGAYNALIKIIQKFYGFE